MIPSVFLRRRLLFGCWLLLAGVFSPGATRLRAQTPAAPAANLRVVTAFGAVGDLRLAAHLAFQVNSREVRASPGTFAASDVGKTIFGMSLGADGVPVSVTSQIVSVRAGGAQATMLDEARIGLNEVRGGIGTDNSAAMQRCWDESARQGLVCWIPAGQFLLAGRPLVIRTHMSVEGASPERTTLFCGPSLRDCIGLDEGPVQFVYLSRIGISGTEYDLPPPRNAASAQRGITLVAHSTGGAGGGLWQSTFSHVEVANFWGDEFTLRGGVGEYLHPNQFLFFEDLELQASRGSPGVGPPADSYRLRLVGQNAQIVFSGGQIHGSIGSQLGNGVLISGAGVVRFEGVTCEWLDSCLDIPNATTVRYSDGWIENVKHVATLGAQGVHGFALDHNHLANSCFDPRTHEGWCVKLASARTDVGVTFAQNTLAWGVARPDALIAAPPGAVVEAPGTLENGVLRDASLGLAHREAGAAGFEQPPWRKATALSPWIAVGGTATVHLAWMPGPFPSDSFTASCVTYGANAVVRVEGIVRQTVTGVEVTVANRDPRSQQRATVNCIGVQ